MAKNLDARQLEQLFHQHFKPLTTFALAIVKDQDQAKEIAHQAFIKLWEQRSNIDTQRNVKAYLYQTVKNLALNYLRDNQKFIEDQNDVLNLQQTAVDFEDLATRSETIAAVVEAIEQLPPQMKQVFVLSRYHGLSHKQIAQKLNISPKTVENHINKALKRLRKKLKNYL